MAPRRLVEDGDADVLEAVRTHVADVLERTRGDDAARERQVRFHALTAELATGFIGLPADHLDAAVGRALERIAMFVEAERAVFVALEMPDETLVVTHEWNAVAEEAPLPSVHGQKGLRWSLDQLRAGRVLYVRDRAELPDGANAEKAAWDTFGIQSILALPVTTGDGELLGFAAFATVTRRALWRDEELPLFDLAATMLRSAFEQQKLRAALDQTELRLHRLLTSGAIGIAAADTDGRMWEANDAALAVLGFSRKDLEAGRVRWNEVTPAEYRPMTANALEQLEHNNWAEPWEQDIYRPDGSRVSILVSLARVSEGPAGLLIYAVDITADRKARHTLALRDRLARLVTLFSTRLIAVAPARIGETIREALREVGGVLGLDRCTVWIDFDAEDGTTMSRCEHVWDRTARAGQRANIPPVSRASLPAWDEDFRLGRPMLILDVETDLPDGSRERVFLARHGVRSGVAVPLIGSGHAPIGFATFASESVMEWPEPVVSLLCVIGETFAAAIVRGRSEEKQGQVHEDLERRIQERTIQLESANRELEAFSYAVSHDLRAPLRSVDGFSRILVEDHAEGLPDDARTILDRIRVTSQRMGELIDALLKLSRITRLEPHFEKVDLSELVREQAAALAAAEPERSVEFHIEGGVHVEAEPRLLAALVDNLLRNAWKFTSPRPHARIEFGIEEGEGGPVHFVRDDGVGFESSMADRLFAPFQRLHRADEFEGHGVGLATVKRIVVVHGGRVWAEGEAGKGATVRFTLGRKD